MDDKLTMGEEWKKTWKKWVAPTVERCIETQVLDRKTGEEEVARLGARLAEKEADQRTAASASSASQQQDDVAGHTVASSRMHGSAGEQLSGTAASSRNDRHEARGSSSSTSAPCATAAVTTVESWSRPKPKVCQWTASMKEFGALVCGGSGRNGSCDVSEWELRRRQLVVAVGSWQLAVFATAMTRPIKRGKNQSWAALLQDLPLWLARHEAVDFPDKKDLPNMKKAYRGYLRLVISEISSDPKTSSPHGQGASSSGTDDPRAAECATDGGKRSVVAESVNAVEKCVKAMEKRITRCRRAHHSLPRNSKIAANVLENNMEAAEGWDRKNPFLVLYSAEYWQRKNWRSEWKEKLNEVQRDYHPDERWVPNGGWDGPNRRFWSYQKATDKWHKKPRSKTVILGCMRQRKQITVPLTSHELPVTPAPRKSAWVNVDGDTSVPTAKESSGSNSSSETTDTTASSGEPKRISSDLIEDDETPIPDEILEAASRDSTPTGDGNGGGDTNAASDAFSKAVLASASSASSSPQFEEAKQQLLLGKEGAEADGKARWKKHFEDRFGFPFTEEAIFAEYCVSETYKRECGAWKSKWMRDENWSPGGDAAEYMTLRLMDCFICI